MKTAVAISVFLVIALMLSFTYVWNKRNPVDVTATPRLSEEEQQKQIEGPRTCRAAGGIPYFEDNRYKACIIKKNISHP